MDEPIFELDTPELQKEEQLYWALKARYERNALIVDAAAVTMLSVILFWLFFHGKQKHRRFIRTSLFAVTATIIAALASAMFKHKFL